MIGLLEIRRRKAQFALIALVVTLISYLILMINGLGVGLNEAAGSALKNFNADAIAYSDRSGLSVIRSEISQQDVAALALAPGVEALAPLGYAAANYETDSGDIDSVALLGFDLGTIAEPEVTSGRPLTAHDERSLLADATLLDAAGLKVGDSLKLASRLTQEEFTIVGEIDQGQFFFQPTAYLLRSTWAELKFGAIPQEDRPAASIVLLKGDGLVGLKSPGVEVVDKDTAFANIEGVSGQQATVTSLRVFGYLIGALVIGAFFYVLTLQKVPQIAVLKAIGASSFFVYRQLLAQVIVVAVIGVVVSFPMAFLTEQALQTLPDSVPISLKTGTFVSTGAALLLTAVAGSLISGRQVLGVDPIIALGQQQ